MIDEEIISEVIFYSYNRKIIDEKILRKFVYSEVDKLDAVSKALFKDIYIHDMDCFLASFDITSGIIEINEELLKSDNSDIGNYLDYNLYIMFLILHEMEHLKENYKLTLNNIESELLKYTDLESIYKNFHFKQASCGLVYNKRKLVYEKYLKSHKFNPSERMADINAMENIIYSLEEYPNFLYEFYDTYLKFYNYVIDFYCTGYKIKNGAMSVPLYNYFMEMDQSLALQKFQKYLKLSSSENDTLNKILDKMKYGFAINKSELNKVKSLKIKR